MSTTTLKDIMDYMTETYGLGRRGSNTATETTSIADDPNFGGHGATDRIEAGCHVRITYDAGGSSAAPEGETVRLSSRPKLTNGVMNVDPSLTALGSGDLFIVLYRDLCFKAGDGEHSLIAKINQALQERTWERRIVPITLLADGDMLKSTYADWTAVTATLSKVSASFPHGLRALRLANSSASGGAYQDFDVEPDESYFIEVTVRLHSTPEDNNALLTVGWMGTDSIPAGLTLDESTTNSREPVILMNPSVVFPSDSVRGRMAPGGNEADADTYWSNIILRKNDAREFTIQDRPAHILELGKLFATTVDTWAERGRRLTESEVRAEAVQLDSGIWQYHISQSLAGQSVWYEEFIRPATLSAEVDTTTVPKEAVAAVAAELLLRPLRSKKQWALHYDDAARAAAVVRSHYTDLRTVRNAKAQRIYSLARV